MVGKEENASKGVQVTRLGSLDRTVLRGRLALELDRERACPLLAQLQGGARHWEDLTEEERSLLRGAPLIDLLLERSFALRYEDPKEMVALADAARVLAEALGSRRYGRKVKADLCARAWTELGNAHRVTDDLATSGAAFDQAKAWAEQGTGSLLLKARYLELLAALYRELRRIAEAGELLDQAVAIYRREGDREALASTLLSRAMVYEEEHEPEQAIAIVLEALEHIEWPSPLRLPAVNSLADNLVGAGLFEAARWIVSRSWRLYRKAGKLNKVRLLWLEGRIALGLGEDGVAEGKLNTARLAFQRAGKNYDSALVGLDLALLYVRQERRPETAWLVNHMLQTFRSLGIARELIASLVLLKKSCEGRRPVEVLTVQIETIAAFLVELQRERPRRSGGA
jgi:tetratricopeptide (TPR) repeat protein